MTEFLQVLWFILIAVLWSGYLILEGFDLGVGMLLRIVAKNDNERSQVVKTIGPHWDGNEVWLLTAGGATFLAFPEWYATMFSGMYLALFLVLVFLILRICALEWRNKINTEKWRSTWDTLHTISAWTVPVLLGVAFANLVQGMAIKVVNPKTLEPVAASDLMAPGTAGYGPELSDPALVNNVHNIVGYDIPVIGNLLSLLTPFTLLGGLVVMALALAQGALFLNLKSTGAIRDRIAALTPKLSIVATGLTAVFAILGQILHSSQPIYGWIPLGLAAVMLILSTLTALTKSFGKSFFFNSVGLIGAVAWIFTSMAPYVMKSYFDVDPATGASPYSLSIWQASASPGTLTVATVATVILVPVILGYTIWAYVTFKARISAEDIDDNAGLDPKKIREGAAYLAG